MIVNNINPRASTMSKPKRSSIFQSEPSIMPTPQGLEMVGDQLARYFKRRQLLQQSHNRKHENGGIQ